jgi:hypothetical protein
VGTRREVINRSNDSIESEEIDVSNASETAVKAPPHILRLAYDATCEGCVTGDPAESCDPRCMVRAIDCPGVTPDCQAWQECGNAGCRDLSADDQERWDLHGVEHRSIDGYLAVMLPGVCFVATADCLPDAVDYLGADPGTYAVRATSDGEGGYDLDIIETLTPAEPATCGNPDCLTHSVGLISHVDLPCHAPAEVAP